MNGLQWIWLLLVLACVVWYSTITFYVAVRGFLDIKHMLRRLGTSRKRRPRRGSLKNRLPDVSSKRSEPLAAKRRCSEPESLERS